MPNDHMTPERLAEIQARMVSADRATMAYREDAVGLLEKLLEESEGEHA